MQDISHAELPPTAQDVLAHVGHRLKRAHTALRGAMDQVLREHDLTVAQYACLEVLAACPGMSSAELARATFVTRQSMGVVLRGLQNEGLLTRPATAEKGRARPATLTDEGRHRLDAAQKAVYAVEARMIYAIPEERLTALLENFDQIVQALTD
ncbi:MarR family winged helix-turn-helix transcriptional regulator [Streptomyces fractus]|uniref:MarR family winged helix-turn-helix transcriptional regulator n=1 Tax=Streptomyces fractus TaxID=641806 RepID=UPI003CF719EE